MESLNQRRPTPEEQRERELEEIRRPWWRQSDVIHATGIDRKTLTNYLDRYGKDLKLERVGRGYRRAFSLADAIVISAIESLAGLGVPPALIVKTDVASHVRKWLLNESVACYIGNNFEWVPPAFLAMTADGSVLQVPSLADIESKHQAWVTLNLKGLTESLARKLYGPYKPEPKRPDGSFPHVPDELLASGPDEDLITEEPES